MKISDRVKTVVLAGVLAVVGISGALLRGEAAYAVPAAVGNAINDTQDPFNGTTDLNTVIKNVINAILYVVGIIAVFMMILGGIQYATSAGDTSKVTKAKNTILYGIVGLVIAILAYAIVNFVINQLNN